MNFENLYEKRQFINWRLLNFFELRFLEKLNNLFHWESDFLQVPPNFETLLRLYGTIGFVKSEKKFVVGYLSGKFDEDGKPTEYEAYHLNTDGNSGSHKYKIGEELILCRNNSLYLSDLPFINWYCNMLKETDISIRYQLINSRLLPVVGVNDDQTKKQLEEVFNSIEAGKPGIFKKDLLDDIQLLNILDNSNIEKMQYLTSFRENLDKRLFTEFGIEINAKDKRAQVSVEEIKGEDDIHSLNYLSYVEERFAFANKMQEEGFDLEVIPSPIYSGEPTEEEIEEPEKMEEESQEEEEKEDENKENL